MPAFRLAGANGAQLNRISPQLLDDAPQLPARSPFIGPARSRWAVPDKGCKRTSGCRNSTDRRLARPALAVAGALHCRKTPSRAQSDERTLPDGRPRTVMVKKRQSGLVAGFATRMASAATAFPRYRGRRSILQQALTSLHDPYQTLTSPTSPDERVTSAPRARDWCMTSPSPIRYRSHCGAAACRAGARRSQCREPAAAVRPPRPPPT